MTLENVRRGIAQLEVINPHDEFAYEKALFTYKTIQDLPILVYQTSSDIRICQARTHDTPKPYENVREISLPTYECVRHFARCNRPFQPKFYGSENRPTSYMELSEYWAETKNFRHKLYVTTGLWVTKKSLDAIIISTPGKSDCKSEYDKYFGKMLDDYIN